MTFWRVRGKIIRTVCIYDVNSSYSSTVLGLGFRVFCVFTQFICLRVADISVFFCFYIVLYTALLTPSRAPYKLSMIMMMVMTASICVLYSFSLSLFGRQYQCNRLPRKTSLRNTDYVSSGTLNRTYSLTLTRISIRVKPMTDER